MREVYAQVAQRLRDGRRFAVATLVDVRNAKPAPIGTSLIVDDDGTFVGNIGAGCHEGEIVELGIAAMSSALSTVFAFELDDELLSGSVCGASLQVAIWVPGPAFLATAERVARGDGAVTFSVEGFDVVIPAKRKLVVVGATDLGAHLARIARSLDFSTTIFDPRAAFNTAARHPDADRRVVDWPSEGLASLLDTDTAVAIVAHDSKIDLPAIRVALESPAPYIGVLGSRRAQNARRSRLRADGVGEAALERLHAPAGLDLGGMTSAQTALSILAEILATFNRRLGLPLSSLERSIHADTSALSR
jgi:xanthine dehydrogenase accessory factor